METPTKLPDADVLKVTEDSDLYPYLAEAFRRYKLDNSRTIPKNIRGKEVTFYLKIK